MYVFPSLNSLANSAFGWHFFTYVSSFSKCSLKLQYLFNLHSLGLNVVMRMRHEMYLTKPFLKYNSRMLRKIHKFNLLKKGREKLFCIRKLHAQSHLWIEFSRKNTFQNRENFFNFLLCSPPLWIQSISNNIQNSRYFHIICQSNNFCVNQALTAYDTKYTYYA